MPPSIYHNFDLLITRSGDDYRAFVVDAPGGDADVTFALPFTADELDFLGDLAGARRGGAVGSSGGSIPDLKELGSLLYGAVVQGKVAAVLATSLDRAAEENTGLRLRLRFSEETSELATLPWEILYDPVQARFLALSESSPILRYLSLPRARPTLLVEPPLRLLAVLVSPPGYEELDLEREWQVLESSLAGLVASGKFVMERLAVPSLAALQERLLGQDVHILHFVGHGVFDGQTGEGALLFADEKGEAHPVSGEALAQRLHNHRSLRLVYLNACQGALASHLTVFSGVAQTLVQQGVPAAVAMQAEITDEAAIQLSRTFYAALAGGRPVDAALTQARVAVAERSAEWAIPVLFSRSPDNRLFDVVEVLPAPDCPYPGMVPFTEKQANVFFGRDKEIDDAIERLRQHPFLTVIGPSGSGKSSLVYAGVIPELRKTKRFGLGEWDVRTMRPSDTRTSDGKAAPMTALRAVLQLPDNATNATPQSLNLQSPHLLFIDQFEETFTLVDPAESQLFLDALGKLIGQKNLYIILTVRADFYPELMACSLWQPIRANRLELTPLGDEELRAAILQPAAQVGVTIDEVLAERLVADAAGESGALPLVQEALVLLWERVERRHLALTAYTEMAEGNRNGLQVAIDRRATTVYNNLPEAAQPLARRIFLRLVQFGEGRLDTRRQQTVDELRAGGDDTQVFDETLAKLIANRLLTTSGQEGSVRRVDIAHEALIGGWRLLQTWIREKRDAESTRRRLEDAARNWIASDKQGGLLDEYELHGAEEWLKIAACEELGVSRNLTDLVQASRQSIADRKAEEEAARQREESQKRELVQEQATAERNRQRSRMFAVGLALALLAVVLVGIFWNQARIARDEAESAATAEATARNQAEEDREIAVTAQAAAETAAVQEAEQREIAETARADAEQQQRIALSNQLAAHSITSLEIEKLPDRALLLAIEAVSIPYAIDGLRITAAEDALHRALSSLFQDPILLSEPNPEAKSLAFGRDGKWLGLVEAGAVKRWELKQRESTATVEFVPATSMTREQFYETAHIETKGASLRSPDGKWEAVVVESSLISLKNLQSTAQASILFGHEDSVGTMLFTPDSRALISISADYTIRLWNLNDPSRNSLVLRGHTDAVTALALNPQNMRLATGSADTTVRIWNLAKPKEAPLVLRNQTSAIRDLAYSPDGRWLAALGEDGEVTIWRDDIDSLVQIACDVSTRNLTAQEWEQAVGSTVYRKTCPELPYPTMTGQFENVKIVDTFLVVGRELNVDGWQLLEKAGLVGLLFKPAIRYTGPSIEQLPNLSDAERESIGRNLFATGSATRLIGTSGFLWQRPELFSVPLSPPDSEQIALDPMADSETHQMGEIWNRNGSLFAAIASELGIDIDVAIGVYAVETGSTTSDRLLIRFENHIFYSEWGRYNQEIFERHFMFDAERQWAGHKWRADPEQAWREFHGDQTSEWEVLEFARTLDEVAALRSISMGPQQIMGFNFQSLGFADVRSMFAVFLSPDTQDRIHILLFFDFIQSAISMDRLRQRDFRAFTRAYNGPGLADRYAELISERVTLLNAMRGSNASQTPMPTASPTATEPSVEGNTESTTASPALVPLPTPKPLDIQLEKPFDGDYPITQQFGENPEFHAQFSYDGVPLKGYNGLDFGVPIGTPIQATADGVVERAEFSPTLGNFVLLEHPWGQSLYSNLAESAVSVGQEVSRGQTIGSSGNSGASTGPYLGFFIRISPYDRADGWGGFSDPLPYLED